MVKVRNIKGTTGHPVPQGFSSFLDYWKHSYGYSLESNVLCAGVGHYELAEVGAHVQIIGNDKHWYIVPVCKALNNSNEPYYVDERKLLLLNK